MKTAVSVNDDIWRHTWERSRQLIGTQAGARPAR